MPSWALGTDRIVHVALYSVLGATLGYGRHRAPGPSHLTLLAIGAIYGATDEWHQAYVPGRGPDPVDWLADVTGVLLGYGLSLLVLPRLVSRTAPRSKEPMTHVSD